MTLDTLCRQEGFRHATTVEELKAVTMCRLCSELLITEKSWVYEQLGEGNDGIIMRLKPSKSGTVLEASIKGKVLKSEQTVRDYVTFVTVKEGG